MTKNINRIFSISKLQNCVCVCSWRYWCLVYESSLGYIYSPSTERERESGRESSRERKGGCQRAALCTCGKGRSNENLTVWSNSGTFSSVTGLSPLSLCTGLLGSLSIHADVELDDFNEQRDSNCARLCKQRSFSCVFSSVLSVFLRTLIH